MRRVYIVCEGETEVWFVREILAAHLADHGVAVTAPRIGRPGHKGGNVSWARLFPDLRGLLRGDSQARVTTLLDYYGMVPGFPGLQDAKACRTTTARAQAVEKAMRDELTQTLGPAAERFIPYVQMHEFEGLLFSDPKKFARGIARSDLAPAFQAIAAGFSTPEDINDSANTAPSKRIQHLFPKYEKPLFGTLAALEIGLSRIRAACPRFDGWVTTLETFGTSASG